MRLKICRIEDIDTANTLVDQGVDFLGFHVLGPTRTGEAETSISINTQLRNIGFDGGTLLTRSVDHGWFTHMLLRGGFRYVQIHRDVDTDSIEPLADLIHRHDAALIQVVDPNIRTAGYARQIMAIADFILYDNYEGGTGLPIREESLEGFPMERAFLAGGITADRARGARDRFNPFAIDVQSWVERADRSKDFDRVRELLAVTQSPPPAVWLSIQRIVSESNATAYLTQSVMAVVRGLHIDVLNGTSAEKSLSFLSALAQTQPGTVYDVHFIGLTPDAEAIVEAMRQTNHGLNRVFAPGPSRPEGWLPAASATEILRGDIDRALETEKTVLITAPSSRHGAEFRVGRIEEAALRVRHMSQGLCEIVLDRDLDLTLVERLQPQRIPEFVIGKAIWDAPDRSTALTRFRHAIEVRG